MNLLDLFVKISVDDGDVDKGFSETSNKAETLAGKLKGGLATAAKAGGAAIAAAGATAVAITKQAVENYGEYEQLVGGVETLFKSSADTVMGYAENAYKTAGMSANEYMTTVTSFSASLLQSMGGDTAAAAEKANLAITDMSDNANKMGTDMELIQNAYRGFAKSNYTMLDNLALGYGGTKEEMERLLADAEKLSGIKYDISSYSDIVDAIHVVQTEMGITGTTAKEASTTIQGSVSAMKSAWANLITGIADENENLNGLIGNVVDSATTAAGNIIPRIEQILSGIGEAITGFAPVLSELIPEMISSTLPTLLTAATSLTEGALSGIVSVLPALLTTAIDALPQLLNAASSIVQNLVSALAEAAPQVLSAGAQLLDQLTSGIESGLPDMISRLPQIIDGVLNYITDSLPTVLKKGEEILGNLIDGIINAIPALIDALPKVIVSLTTFFAENGPKILETGINLIGKLIVGIVQAIPALVKALPQIISAIVQGIGNLMSGIVDVGKQIVRGLWEGIKAMGNWIKEKVSGFFSGIVDNVKGVLGIHSPSRVFAGIGENMALGLGEGWDDEYGNIKRGITSGLDFGTASVGFADSGIGISSAAIVNSMGEADDGGGSTTLNLMLPDGTKLATYTLPFLIRAAAAAGTPIANPQTA